MKRFHVWTGADYYPMAGLEDYDGSFETLEEAERYAKEDVKWADWYVIAATQEDGSLATVVIGYLSS